MGQERATVPSSEEAGRNFLSRGKSKKNNAMARFEAMAFAFVRNVPDGAGLNPFTIQAA